MGFRKKLHFFVSQPQYIPSKPICKKCGFTKKNYRHKRFGIALAMHIMFGDGSSLRKLSSPQRKCENCFKKKKLTKHHLKDHKGNKTGEIQLLCRDCHDIAEDEYVEKGIVKPTSKGSTNHKKSPIDN